MVKFITYQNRLPWNNEAKWLYKTAQIIADDPETHEVDNIDDFVRVLKQIYQNIFKSGQRVAITRWNNSCGLDKPNSVDHAAFVITMVEEKEVVNG